VLRPPPNDCPAGECLAITEVCQNVVDTIAGNEGAPPAPAALTGYQNPGAISPFGDRPYGEDISISGTADCLSGVDYYEIEWTTTPANAASWAAVPPAALGDGSDVSEFSPGFTTRSFRRRRSTVIVRDAGIRSGSGERRRLLPAIACGWARHATS
jgi:hypothetical protein